MARARSWTTKRRDQLAEEVPDILTALVTQARAGDTKAAKLILERVLPSLKPTEQPVKLALKGTPSEQAEQILAAMAGSKLTIDKAGSIFAAMASQAKIAETDELEKRIVALEMKGV